MEQFGFELDRYFKPAQQKISDNEEIDISDYDDGNFECECPKCGFKFNRG